MNKNELPYMDIHKLIEPKFIICKFAEHEKRISGLEYYMLKLLEEKKEGEEGGTND